MSSPDRRTFLTCLAALPLAACGFTPAYAPQGAAGRLRGRIAVQAPVDRNSFDLVRALEQRLGAAEAPLYNLSVSLVLEQLSGGITPDNEITRYQLKGTATWSLSAVQDGARISGGVARSFTSWSATGSTVAGLAAGENANRRLMVILADQITTQIVAKTPDIAP
jgi:LPS-assembly lipoprotein